MMKAIIVVLLVCTALSGVFAQEQYTTIPLATGVTRVDDTVYPCQTNYYRTDNFASVQPGDYLWIQVNVTQNFQPIYVWIGYADSATSITNEELPSWFNHETECHSAFTCQVYVLCRFVPGQWLIAVEGANSGPVNYNITVRQPNVAVSSALLDGGPDTFINVTRPDTSGVTDPPLNYAHYYFILPQAEYDEGTFFSVNISGVGSNSTFGTIWPTLRLNYLNLATSENNCIYGGCVDWANGLPQLGSTQACTCDTTSISDQCNVTVSPCQVVPGSPYYFSVELYDSIQLNYTLAVTVYGVKILDIQDATYYYNNTAYPYLPAHFRLPVDSSQISADGTRLRVSVESVVGGTVRISIQQSHLAGDLQGCYGSITQCVTPWSCNLILEKCYFSEEALASSTTEWYIAVEVVTQDTGASARTYGVVTFTVSAWLETDPPVVSLVPNPLAPMATWVQEAAYNFYMITIPEGLIDTWLFIELYPNQNDTEVILYMLQGAIPGGECYAEPDFICETQAEGRESCQFQLKTCELTPGPLYLSVYGQHTDSLFSSAGDNFDYGNTYYNYPVHYTLWSAFYEPVQVISNVTYTEHVYIQNYNHYYIVARNIELGQYLMVEFANIKGGNINGFVNLNYLAGDCPCYTNMFNCTGDLTWPECDANAGNWDNYPNTRLPSEGQPLTGYTGQQAGEPAGTFCTIYVTDCDFVDGIWYIGVYGSGPYGAVDNGAGTFDNLNSVGYTLTATIFPPPPVNKLYPKQIVTGTVDQSESDHYQVVASGSNQGNLVVKLIYLNYATEIVGDYISLYVGSENLASGGCNYAECQAGWEGYSYCTVVVPTCDFEGSDWYVNVYGTVVADIPVRYTLQAWVEAEPVTTLTSGQYVFNTLNERRYQHYKIQVEKTDMNYIDIELYISSDQGAAEMDQNSPTSELTEQTVAFYLQLEEMAGRLPCYSYLDYYECNTTSSCHWQIENCDLVSGTYYFSVFTQAHNWYDQGVEYTLLVTLMDAPSADLQAGEAIMAYIWPTDVQHYTFEVTAASIANYQDLTYSFANVKYGSIAAYLMLNQKAGSCPCYQQADYNDFASTAGTCNTPSSNGVDANYCEITIPYCQLVNLVGTHWLAIEGVSIEAGPEESPQTGDGLWVPTGYTIEAMMPVPNVTFNAGTLNPSVTLLNNSLTERKYWHYRFTVPSGATPYSYLQVNVSRVDFGSVSLYYNVENPGTATSCGAVPLQVGASGELVLNLAPCYTPTDTFWITAEVFPTTNTYVSYDFSVALIPPITLSGPGATVTQKLTDGLYRIYHINAANINNPAGTLLQIELDFVYEGDFNVYVNTGYPWPKTADSCCSDVLNSGIVCDPGFGNTCFVTLYPTPLTDCALVDADYYITVLPNAGNANFTISYNQPNTAANPATLAINAESQAVTIDTQYAYRQFSVPVTVPSGSIARLTIEVNWLSGSGEAQAWVYEGFPANPGCNSWTCGTNNNCSLLKYVDEVCCLTSGTYFVGVQLQTNGSTIQFSITPRLWIEQATSALPFAQLIDHSTTGVQGELVTNYYFDVTDTALDAYSIYILNFTYVSPGSELQVYLRRGYKAGPYNAVDDCYSYQFTATCGVTFCYVTIPYCVLTPATYYIGLYNPDFYSIANYTMIFNATQPSSLAINTWSNTTIWGTGTYQHYIVPITSDLLALNKEIQVIALVLGGGSISAWTNFDGPAGAPGDSCYGQVDGGTCDGNNNAPACFFPYNGACTLIGNDYLFVSVKLESGSFANYALIVETSTTTYNALTGSSSVNLDLNNDVYPFVWQAIQFNLPNTAPTAWYYSIDLTAPNVPAIVPGSYLIFNITQVTGAATDFIIYDEYCFHKYTCDLGAGSGSSCIINTVPLTPCSLENEVLTYYVAVYNAGFSNFTFQAILFEAPVYDLPTDGTWLSNHIYEDRYYTYLIPTPQSVYGARLDINFNVSCGAIQVWLSGDVTAGPDCYQGLVYQTNNFNPGTTNFDTLEISLDTCNLYNQNIYMTVLVQQQYFQDNLGHDYVPTFWMVNAEYYTYTYDQISLDCWNEFTNAYPLLTNQVYFDIDTANVGAYVLIDAQLPDTATPSVGGIAVSRNHTVGFSCDTGLGDSNPAPYAPYCNFADGVDGMSCRVTIPACNLVPGRYYISVVAPTGTTIRPTLVNPYIPSILPDQMYSGAVADTDATLVYAGVGTGFPQYYKISNLNSGAISNFYLSATISNVFNGQLSLAIVPGYTPTRKVDAYTCYPETTCIADSDPASASYRDECTVVVEPCDDLYDTYFLVVTPVEQYCTNTSTYYDIEYTTTVAPDALPVPTIFCDDVYENEYHFYYLNPASLPTDTILEITVSSLMASETVDVYTYDGKVATSSCDIDHCTATGFTGCTIEHSCHYDELYVSVYGTDAAQPINPINYLIHTNYTTVPNTPLTNGTWSPYTPDCAGEGTYYTFVIPTGTDFENSWVQVELERLDPTDVGNGQLYVPFAPGTLPDPNNEDCNSLCASTLNFRGEVYCNSFRICDLAAGTWWIYVYDTRPYQVRYHLHTGPTALTLGQASAPQNLDIDQYAFYYVDVTTVTNGDNLVVTLDNFNGGNLRTTVFYGTIGGVRPASAVYSDTNDGCVSWASSSLRILPNAANDLYSEAIVPYCVLEPGRYYISVYAYAVVNCQPATYTITPAIVNLGVSATAVTNNTQTNSQLTGTGLSNANYYSFSAGLPDNYNAVIHVRLWNVTGGTATVYGYYGKYATPTYGSTCYQYSCTVPDGYSSCAFFVDSCDYNTGTWFFTVEGVSQDFTLDPITYTLTISDQIWQPMSSDPTGPNTGFDSLDNVAFGFYVIPNVQGQSLSIHVTNPSGENLWVMAAETPCHDYNGNNWQSGDQNYANWTMMIECKPYWYSGICHIDIPTLASHPGATSVYVWVYSGNATYSIFYTSGTDNCAYPQALDLPFCAQYTTYPVWQWMDPTLADSAAECFYEELYEQFYWSNCGPGITPPCEQALQQFACMNWFRPCDTNGFYTGVTRSSCLAVEDLCNNLFESVNLESYTCQADFYIDDGTEGTFGRSLNEAEDVVGNSATGVTLSALLAIFSILFVLF